MKKIHLTSIALLVVAAIAITSCGTNRDGYYSQQGPARYRSSISLIISPYPGLRMERYPDGRYYYRSPEGYMYWRGYDNRFYLDRSYHNRVHYNQREYSDWNRNYRGSHRKRRY